MRKFLLSVSIVVLVLWGVAATTHLRSVAMTNSTVDSSPIGATTPSSGVFTSLTDSALSTGGVCSASGTLTTCGSTGFNLDWTDTGCALANSTDSTCASTTTLPGGGFSSGVYSVECTPENNAAGSGGTTIPVVVFTTQAKTSTALTYQLSCTFGCGSVSTVTTTIDCHAHHT